MNFKKIIAIVLALVTVAALLTACSRLPKEAFDADGRFDYFNSDMTRYIAIDKKDYTGSTVKIQKMLDGSDEGVMAYIDMLREENATSTGNKIVGRAVVKGDTVMLYYEGWLNGEKFQGGSNMDDKTPHALVIGSGSFIPGFEDALIGIVPNQTSRDNMVDIPLTFPTDYHSAEMAGKSVIFKVYIEYIDEIAPAEYTEKFITETLKYTTTDKDIKASFEKYIKNDVIPTVRDNEILSQIWESLFDVAVVKSYPETEITHYYEQYVAQYKSYQSYYAQYGITFNTLDEFVIAYLGLDSGADWQAETRAQCEIDVQQTLIYHYIAQVENITITDADYQESITYYVNYYADYKYTAAQIESELGSRFLKEHALFENVQDFLIENCNVIYE